MVPLFTGIRPTLILVERDRLDAGVVLESFFVPIAVMHIDVQDGHPSWTPRVAQQVRDGRADAVEMAEPKRALAVGLHGSALPPREEQLCIADGVMRRRLGEHESALEATAVHLLHAPMQGVRSGAGGALRVLAPTYRPRRVVDVPDLIVRSRVLD